MPQALQAPAVGIIPVLMRLCVSVSRAAAAIMATWLLRIQLSCCIEYVIHSFEIVEPGLLYAVVCSQNVVTICRLYCVHFSLPHLFVG